MGNRGSINSKEGWGMIEIEAQAQDSGGWTPLVVARTVRAVCNECGAHAAVVTSGASVTGACSVCGGQSLRVLDENVPPPRTWVR
jgi:hypothetical protein